MRSPPTGRPVGRPRCGEPLYGSVRAERNAPFLGDRGGGVRASRGRTGGFLDVLCPDHEFAYLDGGVRTVGAGLSAGVTARSGVRTAPDRRTGTRGPGRPRGRGCTARRRAGSFSRGSGATGRLRSRVRARDGLAGVPAQDRGWFRSGQRGQFCVPRRADVPVSAREGQPVQPSPTEVSRDRLLGVQGCQVGGVLDSGRLPSVDRGGTCRAHGQVQMFVHRHGMGFLSGVTFPRTIPTGPS